MNSDQVKISAQILNSSSIQVQYETPAGNIPARHENWIGVWPGEMLPTDRPPLKIRRVESRENTGEEILDTLALQRRPYIVGYGFGPGHRDVCATVSFSPDTTPQGSPGEAFYTSITIEAYTSTQILVDFETPSGNDPRANRNWIGLWAGEVADYSGENLLISETIQSALNRGSQTIDLDAHDSGSKPCALAYNTTYTVAYGMNERRDSIAATVTFRTGEELA